MTIVCGACGRSYDDTYRLTYCPHNALDGLCLEHDLYGCPYHEPTAETHSPLIANAARYDVGGCE